MTAESFVWFFLAVVVELPIDALLLRLSVSIANSKLEDETTVFDSDSDSPCWREPEDVEPSTETADLQLTNPYDAPHAAPALFNTSYVIQEPSFTRALEILVIGLIVSLGLQLPVCAVLFEAKAAMPILFGFCLVTGALVQIGNYTLMLPTTVSRALMVFVIHAVFKLVVAGVVMLVIAVFVR